MTRLTEHVSDQPRSWEGSSFWRAGPLYRVARMLRVPGSAGGIVSLGPALALVTWVPLAILSALGNAEATGPAVSFLQSAGTHVRLLVAIPLFFVAEAAFDLRVGQAIRAMVASQLVSERQLPLLDGAVRQAKRVASSWILEAGILGVTVILIASGIRVDLPGELSAWRQMPAGRLTPVGWWYLVVSLPIYQFLLWRWCAHLLIWCGLLWRVRRLDLQLLATHPDTHARSTSNGDAPIRRRPDRCLAPPTFSPLADLANAFDVIGRMRALPITRRQVLSLVAAAVLPALPLVLFVIPLDDLIFHL